MDHRLNNRLPTDVDVDVEIRCPGGSCLAGKARDVSFHGMFIEVDGRLDPPTFVMVQVVADGRRLDGEIPALVVRTTKAGLGVMFADYDRSLLERIAAR
ncbi:MAG: PilZ domain-containing protein [Gammaproteobacteria bacterium]